MSLSGAVLNYTMGQYSDKGQLLLQTYFMVKFQMRFGFQEAIISGSASASIQFNSLSIQILKSYYDIKMLKLKKTIIKTET
jgi:hypothetical protein